MPCLRPVSLALLLRWPLCSAVSFLMLTWLWCTERRRPTEKEKWEKISSNVSKSRLSCNANYLLYFNIRRTTQTIQTTAEVPREFKFCMELKLDYKVWDLTQVPKSGRRRGGEFNFSINSFYRTNKLQSWTFMPAAPLPPLSHTSCDSPKPQPLGYKGGSCARQPRSRSTFTRKSALPVNQPDFLWTDWDLALSQV